MPKDWWVWPLTVFASVNSFGFWVSLWISMLNQGYTESVVTTVTHGTPENSA